VRIAILFGKMERELLEVIPGTTPATGIIAREEFE
jgi:hypothetical protein